MTFHILTLFPDAFESYLRTSMIKRAQEAEKIRIKLYNIREFAGNKWNKADDRPYGGGPGMVLYAQPILRAVEHITQNVDHKKTKIILLSPGGKEFSNGTAKSLSKKYSDIILVCGHYEGIDYRVKKILKADELSIGPYVLTGGELPALVVIDATARHIEGVLGNESSIEENRVSSSETYTRPEILEYKGKKYRVPKVLLSGDHKKIDLWKKSRSHDTPKQIKQTFTQNDQKKERGHH